MTCSIRVLVFVGTHLALNSAPEESDTGAAKRATAMIKHSNATVLVENGTKKIWNFR